MVQQSKKCEGESVYIYIYVEIIRKKKKKVESTNILSGTDDTSKKTRESGLSVGEYVRRKDRPPVLYFSLSDCFIVISL